MSNSRGFTLIEVTIVAMIIAILMTIVADIGEVDVKGECGKQGFAWSDKQNTCLVPKAKRPLPEVEVGDPYYKKWVDATEGCPIARERLESFTRQGTIPLSNSEKLVLSDYLDGCLDNITVTPEGVRQ